MYGFRAKLATMGAGKTEDLIREYYTHKRKVDRTGATIITVKPAKDTRNVGISSRNGLSLTADVVVLPNQNLEDLLLQIEFDKELIIHYRKNCYTNTYKRVISKLDNGKFSVATYYRDKKINKIFKSKIEFTEEQIKELIDAYLKEFNIKKTVEYN